MTNRPDASATLAQPSPDWRAFTDLILKILSEPAYRNWTCLATHRQKTDRETNDDEPRDPGARRTRSTSSAPDDPLDVDGLLDMVEQEGMDEHLPPCPDTAPARESHHTPRVPVMMHVLRLARTFRTAERFRETVATPGAVTALSGIDPGQEDLVSRLLDAMVWRDELCPGKPRVHVSSVDDAVAQGRRPDKLLFDQFSASFGDAMEHGQPILIPQGARAALSEALQPVVTARISLAPFDIDMLLEVLARVYPDSDVSNADLRTRLSEADIDGVSAQDLTLATRAPTAEEALSRLLRTRDVPDNHTPGLSEFPLAPDIRAPIEAMLSDLRAWQAGEISWDDVSRGILLSGPPGCGKTEIPRLLAREADVAVRASSLSQWQSGGVRSSDLMRQMRQFFDEAASASPCIVFIDELDAVGDRGRPHDHNSSWTDSVVGGLLECLDGFEESPGIVVMGATNHPQKIDAALRRPGRFDRTLTIRQPTPDLLPQAFRWHLGGDLPEADLDALTGIATGMTGAEVAATVRDARGTARRARRGLALDDLTAAITDRRPPLDPGLRWQVAVHECGHAIVAHATGRATVNLLSLTAAGGEASMTATPSGLHLDELEADVASLLAGRAAERLMLGRPSGGAGGQEDSDLAEATRRAVGIELSLGLGESGIVWHGPPERGIERLRFDRALQARVRARLDAAEDNAMTLLAENKSVLTSMAAELVRDGALSGDLLQEFLDSVTDAAPEKAGANPA